MLHPFFCLSFIAVLASHSIAGASGSRLIPKEISLNLKNSRKSPPTIKAAFSPFTGRISGSKVRIRLQPDLDGHIIGELTRSEIVAVVGQEGDYYCIAPPSTIETFIFRSFVLDGVVEGNRVNVRIAPDLDAPIVGHLSSGDHIEGTISDQNRKWLKIPPPANTFFYVSKDYVEYAGGPELKNEMEERKKIAEQLFKEASLYSTRELAKEFEKIDFEQIKVKFLTIVHGYADAPRTIEKAKHALAEAQEAYLEKRIAYLEKRASDPSFKVTDYLASSIHLPMREIREKVERAIYASWAKLNDNKSMQEFYQEQKMVAVSLEGVLEAFQSPVKNKPGDFIVKAKNLPIAYVYSTKIDLKQYVGKKVKLTGSPRSNNHFAFPAYFVHEVE